MWLGHFVNIFSTYLTLYTVYTHLVELLFFLIVFTSVVFPKMWVHTQSHMIYAILMCLAFFPVREAQKTVP